MLDVVSNRYFLKLSAVGRLVGECVNTWVGTLLMLLVLFGFPAASYIHTDNLTIIEGFVVGLVLLLVIAVVFIVSASFSKSTSSRRTISESESKFEPYFLLIMLSPILICTFGAAFVFNAPDTQKVWVVGDRVTGYDGWTWGIPFVDPIVGINTDQTISMPFYATTSDGVRVSGFVNATFGLERDSDVVKRVAHSFVNPNTRIQTDLVEMLQGAFAGEIALRNSEDLRPTIRLESNTSQVDRSRLSELGIVWGRSSSGSIQVTNIHPDLT